MREYWDGPVHGAGAGDALFRYYNGFATRNRTGETVDDKLDVLRRFAMARERPVSAPLHQKARVPRYRRRVDADGLAVFPVDGGRRKASFILEKLKEDFADAGLPPPPARAVMDSKEKQRLQTIFEWSGSDMKAEDLAPKIAPVRRVVKGSKEEKEHLMDSIAREIDERESFLQDMEKYGRDQKYRSQIRWEIQDRINQMKQLDRLISEEDAQLLAKKVVQKQDGHGSKRTLQWR